MPRRATLPGRTLRHAATAAAVLVSVAACGSGSNTPTSASTGQASGPAVVRASDAASSPASARASGSPIACNGSGEVLGAGSTAQANAIDIWKTTFSAACQGITINYGGGGSGAGIQQFTVGKVAFAGSDTALKPAEVDATKQVCTGGQGIDLPMVAGLVSIVFNAEGVDKLVLDGPTIAKIFNSEITQWNDPAIVALNPGVTLPTAGIEAIHRSDDSGTTANLTSYLAATSGGAWPYPPSKTWAGKGGESANGSAGVAAQVKQNKNSIGYVELSYAQTNGLKSAAVATGASQPVDATAANAATTFAGAQVAGTGDDLALTLDYATKQEGAYPIVLVTYEIVCDKGNKAATLPALKSFLTYTASDAAQQAIGAKGYVPLPAEITGKVGAVVSQLS
ncbi:phosphate ABC transporter substrate-binding protein PstS [Kitasatospora sp. NPDC048538]|uniref:phosphate ABC transporter substrate-binding protein PstS n=1 Tax=unclassified Kitasatospora TaxID=2633591 RepID=UPI0033FBDC1D